MGHTSVAAISAALMASVAKGSAQPPGNVRTPGSPPFDQDVFDFWNSRVMAPYEDYTQGIRTMGRARPEPRESTFLFVSAKTGLIPAAALKPNDIDQFPEDGDANIETHVQRFRPSKADSDALQTLETGTLRIDVKQVAPMPGLTEALAWVAMATLASRTKGQKVPSLENAKFDAGSLWGNFQQIPLTGGLGFWSWNFFMKKREGFWGQLLDHVIGTLKTVEPVIPLLRLPGVAVSGLSFLNQVMGGIQAQGESQWLFSGLDGAVCTSKKGFETAGGLGAAKLPLTTGSYIIAPKDSVAQFRKDWVIEDGYIIPPNTDPLQIYKAAAQILPDVSYVTISVRVTPPDSKAKTTGSAAEKPPK
jgi:hypothetical protein